MNARDLWTALPAVCALSLADATAQTINWYNNPKTNLTSSDQDMGAGFQFQLGVFTGGFVPTATNISQWQTFWVSNPDLSAPYNPATKSFNSNFTVTGNAAPFTVGAKAYVWGRSTSATGDEWILFRKTDWNWPTFNPTPNPNDLTWNTATADQVILGTINAGGTPFLMKSEAVVSYPQWQAANLYGEPLNAPKDDPDQDGISNLLEYAFGTAPVQAGPPPSMPTSFVDVSGMTYLQISIPRLRNRLATVVVEVSGDLLTWNSGPTRTVEVSNTPTQLVVRDLTPGGPGLRRFMRLRMVVTP